MARVLIEIEFSEHTIEDLRDLVVMADEDPPIDWDKTKPEHVVLLWATGEPGLGQDEIVRQEWKD